ncbi:hypothetical protein B9Z55_012316 [Caenorhabditis nigoni]|uniref:Sdz-33 F-box domain-containing protein n=1 Tax=Caenorhabditis nigoni TaxID=1611254 RepID=A0A2G5TWN8_9PELO|nr:hypothetical protein B9Z55_012316 [Caenorhabditis nigoni]
MMEHICEVFRSPIRYIDIFEESLIEWIINVQPKIRYVWIRDNVIISVESMNRISKIFSATERFGLESVAIDEDFQYTEPIPCPAISIYNSSWITLSSILNGNNSIIRLYDSKLTPKDINTILKEWQMGTKLRNLEYLKIEISTDLDVLEDFKDLNLTVEVVNDRRPVTA